MKRRGDITPAIDRRIKKQVEGSREGTIQAVTPTTAYVIVLGSTTPIPCGYDNPDVEVGKHCTIQWIKTAHRHIITNVYGTRQQISPGAQPIIGYELAPPSDLATSNAISGNIVVSWNVPPQQAVSFEVQQNETPVDAGAITIRITRGSMVIVGSEVPLYFRVRSISTDFHYSSWSAWTLGTPGTPPAIDRIEQILVGLDGEILIGLDGSILIGLA